jgi:hypothetical protein
MSPATKKFREMAQPEAKAKAQADLERPPFEFLRGQIAPFEVLPFYKPNHWGLMTIEVRSSREDFSGSVRTQPLSIYGSQRDIVVSRPVSMDRNTPTRMSFPLFMPPGYMPKRIGKLVDLDLYREGGLRPTEIWQANVRAMEPHQMVVLVLAREPGTYTGWTKMMAGIPSSISRDASSLDNGRYYRFVLNEQVNASDSAAPMKPFLAPSALYWTTISHAIWDGMDPNLLDVDQQRAMLDWLHWGGQLTIVGGADSRLGLLRESFLSPYLPADPGGTNEQFDTQSLKTLAEVYRPPFRPSDSLNEEERENLEQDNRRAQRSEWAVKPGVPTPYYDPATPIVTAARTPLFVTGLRPRPGAATIPFGSKQDTNLAVEWRVGRGRVTILAVNLTDPALARWRGLDTLVRRVVLRRPEEVRPPPRTLGGEEPRAPMISGSDLSWMRIAARDTGGPYTLEVQNSDNVTRYPGSQILDDVYPKEETCTWTDSAILPVMAREMLESASGLRIPAFSFVAKALGVYLAFLVPINWLVFRSVGRREWAWLAVPPLALVAALSVERLAAYDLGFTRGRDEIALLEMQSDYPRGHLTRFGALASTGRDSYRIAFPADLNAVCLPLAYSASRAEQRETGTFAYMPEPALTDFRVQPRSLSYYRSEQMVGLPGPIRMVENESGAVIENRTRMALRDVTVTGPDDAAFRLGDIGPGESKPVRQHPPASDGVRSFSELLGNLDPQPFLDTLRTNPFKSEADKGSWRLIAWSDAMIEGVAVEPAPDRVRGLTLVLVHLKTSAAPNPSDPFYDRSTRSYLPPSPPPQPASRAPGMMSIFEGGPGLPGLPGSGRRMNRTAANPVPKAVETLPVDASTQPPIPTTRSPQ